MKTLIAQPLAGPSLLEANLLALAIRSPRVAECVRRASIHPRLKWIATAKDGAWSAELDGRALTSRRDPVGEGERLADTVDFAESGVAAVIGFGLGYHVAALARRAGNHSLVLVYEPDVALLRSVLEHADFTDWLAAGRVFLFTDAEDAAAISESLAGMEALVGLGMRFVEHAPSLPRLGESARTFASTLTRVVAAFRTQVVTTMTQMQVTVRNLLMNLDHYVGGAGVADLAGAARGFPAVVVSAGPSLERNLHLLAQPGVRERVVIIAVQTVLKPMLARGIRPHFVTALDFHEISRRFYEGLTPADVEGITLVAEPKANPAILDAFPGDIRLVGSEALDELLGPELAGDHGRIAPGATVAHLAYYLARHLGCDPVILIGQDLAFTDGQYYAAGAAIHDVWATELNPFNTLEMMEWERIARWRGHLRKVEDHHGGQVYTDEQMATYLAQFERDFLADAERGLTTIDATEGGARKSHTIVMPLRDALATFAKESCALRLAPCGSPETQDPRPKTKSRLRSVKADARKIAAHSRRARDLLERMLDCREGDPRINRLIEEAQSLGAHVRSLEPAYGLVHRMNQAGAFRRYRADRAIALEEGLSPIERQRRQIERDIANVSWLAEAADELDDLLGAAIAALDGAPKRTRDPVPTEPTADAPEAKPARARVAAVIPVDAERSALGFARDLIRPIAGRPALARTLTRLASCDRLDGVILLTSDRARLAALMPETPASLRCDIMEISREELRRARESIAAARLWSPTCWRGGLGHMTCYDEVFDPALVGRTLDGFGYDSALILGPDWCAIDPALCDAVIDRHRESPARLPLVFTQAPPGLAPCLIARTLCRKLEEGRAAGDPFATIGGVLGFRPTQPRLDPIAEACCVQIPPEARSMHARFIADSEAGVRAVEWMIAERAPISASSPRPGGLSEKAASPQHLIIELCGGRADEKMSAADAARLLREFASLRPDGVVTFAGRGDPLEHPDLPAIVRAAREAGVAGVHVRTAAVAEASAIDALLDARPSVVSVDLHAADEATYRALTSTDHFQRSLLNTERMLASRRVEDGLPTPWIVPRVARRDATIAQIEGMYDRALFFAGTGTIDPPAYAAPGERIAPLPKPASAVARDAAARMHVRCDGVVIADEADPECTRRPPGGDALKDGLSAAWTRLLDRRRSAWEHHGPAHPDLRTLY